MSAQSTLHTSCSRYGVLGIEDSPAAVELKLFTRLGSESMTGPENAEALGLDARANQTSGMGLSSLKYSIARVKGANVTHQGGHRDDKASPAYVGGILVMANSVRIPG